MIINLYSKTETNFNTNGQASLDAIECIFTPVINDVWKLELTIPYDKNNKYKLVENGKFIRVAGLEAVTEQSSTQIFRIYDFKKQDDSVYILAYPVGLDARFETYAETLDLRESTMALAISAINNMGVINGVHKYTVTTDLGNERFSKEMHDVNIISALNGEDGIVSKAGEICYDNYNIKVNDKLGNQDSPVTVRYGKNIQSMSYELDESNVVTRLYPKSRNGDILNAVAQYRLAATNYVDSPKINNYPIVHNYFVETPYVLTQTSDDGSWEYLDTISIYNAVKTMAYNLAEYQTNVIMDINYSSSNINLEWIKWFAGLTLESDGTEGYAERVARLASVNCISEEYRNIIKKAIVAGFNGYFSIVNASYEWENQSSGEIWKPNDNDSWKWHGAWAKDGNTWKRINDSGYHTNSNAEDKTEWKWFKPKGKKYKRFGNKKKNYYLRNGLFKLDGVWYYFDDDGKSYKAKALFNSLHFDTYYDNIATNVITSLYNTSLQAVVEAGERTLFTTLYTQMTTYCTNMFTYQKIDEPAVTMEIDMVDLSKTTEYKNYEQLLKVHLGDKVKCINSKLDIVTTQRVTGLEYDVVRGFNRKVTIGMSSDSVISMINNVGGSDTTKYVAGEGIEIVNNVIRVIPNASVKDVLVDGESVVFGGVATIDMSTNGLQYFVETENALYGSNDYMELIKDGRYAPDVGGLIYENETDSYITQIGVTLFPNHIRIEDDSRAVIAYVPQTMAPDDSYPLRIANIQYNSSGYGGILLLSNYIEFFNDLEVLATYYSRNKSTGQESSSTGFGSIATFPAEHETTMICHVYTEQGSEMFYNAYICFASAEVEIDDETWYGLFIWKNGTIFNKSNYTSIQEYLPKAELPHNAGAVVPYSTLGQLVTQAVPLWKPADGSCSGIAKANNLAFFAGGDDELGTNAPIKIFTDGTYQGLDKVEDVQSDGVSIVSNKIASVNTMIGATSESAGSKGLVPQPLSTDRSKYLKGDGSWADIPSSVDFTGATSSADGAHGLVPKPFIADRTKFLKGDGSWGVPTDTTYNDFTGATAQAEGVHGLVPKPLIADKDKFLKGDGTWAEAGGGGGGTSDLDAVELTKAQYDALTPEQKADEDKIYFVKDYIPPQPGGGSSVSITPAVSSGTKIADYEIDGVSGALYVPADIKNEDGWGGTFTSLEDVISMLMNALPNGVYTEDRIAIDVGESVELQWFAVPSNASVSWSVDNQLAVSVNNGVITGLASGIATVTGQIDGMQGHIAQCRVDVG